MAVEDWMPIGMVAGSFGIHGELKVDLLTDFPERFSDLKEIHIGPDRRRFSIESSRKHNRQMLLKLAGIESPEQIDDLRGLDLQIPRSEAVALPPGHYFLEDLIGIAAFSEDGVPLGEISEVLRTGSNDVYVVGKGHDALLIPGIADAVAELDQVGRRLIVRRWVLDSAE